MEINIDRTRLTDYQIGILQRIEHLSAEGLHIPIDEATAIHLLGDLALCNARQIITPGANPVTPL